MNTTMYGSEREANESRGRMATTWACMTLRQLGVEIINEGGWWNICTPWGWETADNGFELSRIARACLDHKRECDRVEGPVQ